MNQLMKQLTEAAELMIMAANGLEEVDYVRETLKRYMKLNPFIAKSNTLLADKENIIRFDGYAAASLGIFNTLSKESLKEDCLFQLLAYILLKEYERECQALEKRLMIYDSSLMQSAKEIRQKNLQNLKQYNIKDEAVNTKKLRPFLKELAAFREEKIRCLYKIETNKEVYTSYSRKILFRKNARKTAESAREYIVFYESELKKIDEKKAALKEKLKTELINFEIMKSIQ